jgi:ribonuclease BN (tRNA processing enzyme)
LSSETKVVLLGTGTPNAEPNRFGASVAVVVGEKAYLVDFGPGVIRRAAMAHEDGIVALHPAEITTAFLTHLHSDHTMGLPDLILTPWMLGRTDQLDIYGPPGLGYLAERVASGYWADIRTRLDWVEPTNPSGFQVEPHEIEAGRIYKDDLVKVEAFRVNHCDLKAYGYRFTTPDRTVVVSGDTAVFEGYEEAYADCDVLVHEVYSAKGLSKRARDWQEYHAGAHTSTGELAKMAAEVQPGLLVLYHQILTGVSEEELLEEVTSLYSGKVAYGHDLDVF